MPQTDDPFSRELSRTNKSARRVQDFEVDQVRRMQIAVGSKTSEKTLVGGQPQQGVEDR